MSQSETVQIDPARAAAMHATLGLDGPAPDAGTALPRFWHWGQFWDIHGPDGLGRDGHPKLGGLIPDRGLPRRMWAGGHLEFHHPLMIGASATRRTTLEDVTEKTGRTGPLAFVTLCHEISQADRLCISERQDLVYREDAAADAPAPKPVSAPEDADHRRSFSVTTTDLFRYSALTFNGHRIHYDLDYAREVEGYPGLVTHGPLLAQRMIAVSVELMGNVTSFAFRAVAPLFHFEAFDVCAKANGTGMEMWVAGPDGRLAMTGQAQSRES